MAVVKCKMCGGNIRVTDDSSGVCDFCGSTMVLPKTTDKQLIKNGKTFLKLGDFKAAKKVYTRLTEEYPDDYRGWWGLIICETKDLSDVDADISLTNLWFKYVKQLASAEKLTPLETKYLEYAKKVADALAENEMSAVKRAIGSFEFDIKWENEKRDQAGQQVTQGRSRQQSAQSISYDKMKSQQADKAVCNARDLVRRCEAERATFVRRFTVAWVFVGLFAIFLLIGLNAPSAECILLAFISIIITFVVIPKKQGRFLRWYDNQLADAQKQLEKAMEARHTNTNQLEGKNERDTGVFSPRVTDANAKIAWAEAKIANSEKYLAQGKEKISEMFFARRFRSIGVNQEIDDTAERLRLAIIDQELFWHDKDDTHDFNAICARCNLRFLLDESDMKNGSTRCPLCNTSLELEIEKPKRSKKMYKLI